MKKLIVSIVSDQTIPNIEFININKKPGVKYLFITTNYCDNEKKHKTDDICKVCELRKEDIDIIKFENLEEHSIKMIRERLIKHFSGHHFDKILVNATGGNKPTSYAVVEFFRESGNTQIYYTDIANKDSFINLFDDSDKIAKLNSLTPTQYLNAYGYKTEVADKTDKYFRFTNKIFPICIGESNANIQIFNNIRNNDIKNLEKEYLRSLGFVNGDFNKSGRKKLARFANGSWFEYFVYEKLLKIKEKIGFKMDLGVTIKKFGKENDLDIAITHKNTLYIFECKYTFVEDEKYYPLSQYLYKLDSINNFFGLRPKSNFITFDKNCRLSKDFNDNSKGYKEYKERMNLLNIGLLTRDDLLNENILLDKIKKII